MPQQTPPTNQNPEPTAPEPSASNPTDAPFSHPSGQPTGSGGVGAPPPDVGAGGVGTPPPGVGSDRPAAGGPPADPTGNRFFAWLRSLDVPRQPGWIGGVCAGIAARLGIDPLIVRGIVVVLAVLGAPALLLYGAAWLLLPDTHNKIQLEEALGGRFEAPLAGIGAFLLLALLPVTQGFWVFGSDSWGVPGWVDATGRTIWSLLVVGLIIAFVVWIARRAGATSAPAASPTSPAAASAFAATSTSPTGTPTQANASTAQYPTTPYPENPTEPYPTAPPAFTAPPPGIGAAPEEIAAWRQRQDLWKSQHDAYRQQQAGEKIAANRAAQERARAERTARYAADRAMGERTRSHPLYSFVVIGLALIAGALVTLLTAGHTVDYSDALLGLTVALAMLALGIIVNGMRGKRAGGASGFAIIILVVMFFTALYPHQADIRYGFDVEFTPTDAAGSETQTYVVGVGDVTIDLTDFYDESSSLVDDPESADPVQLLVGAADVTVILPEGEYVAIDAEVGAGEILTLNEDGEEDSGLFNNFDTEYAPSGSDEWDGLQRRLDVTVRLGAGNITIIEPEGARQ